MFSIRCGAELYAGKGATFFEGSPESAYLAVVDCPDDTVSTLQTDGGAGREIEFIGSFSVVFSGRTICTGVSATGGTVSAKVFPVEAVTQEVNGRTIEGASVLPRYSLLMALEESTVSDGLGNTAVLPSLAEIETFFPRLVSGKVRIRQVL